MGTSSGLLYCLLRRNLRHCVGIDRVNYALDPAPQCEVSEYLHNAAAIGKGRLLKNRQIFHHAILHNVFHDLIYEINLSAIKIRISKIL